MVSLAQMDNPSFRQKYIKLFSERDHDQTSAFSTINPRSRAFNDQWFLCIATKLVRVCILYDNIYFKNGNLSPANKERNQNIKYLTAS